MFFEGADDFEALFALFVGAFAGEGGLHDDDAFLGLEDDEEEGDGGDLTFEGDFDGDGGDEGFFAVDHAGLALGLAFDGHAGAAEVFDEGVEGAVEVGLATFGDAEEGNGEGGFSVLGFAVDDDVVLGGLGFFPVVGEVDREAVVLVEGNLLGREGKGEEEDEDWETHGF